MSVEISQHSIEKLTHYSEEIRHRAFFQIETKFARAQCHNLDIVLNPTELCIQLIRWFGCKPLKSVERVLELLARVLETYEGLILEKLSVRRLKSELSKVQKLLKQIPLESTAIDKINNLLSKYDKIMIESEDENFAGIMEKLKIADDNDETENFFTFAHEFYEMTWSKPTTADYNSLKFMADVLTNPQSTNEKINNALEYLQVTMLDFPAEYMLQSPHIFVKLLHLLELNEYLKNHVVTVLRTFLRSLKQRLRKRRNIDSYSKQQIHAPSKSLLQLTMPSKSQLKIEKAMELLMKKFLEELEIEPISTRSNIIKTFEAFEDILMIINMQHLCINSEIITQTHRVLTQLKNIFNENEEHTTLARTKHICLTFILHDMCILNAKRSQLYQCDVLKPHLCDYSLQIHFPKRSNSIKNLIFSIDSDLEQSYEFLKTYETSIKSAIILLKEENHQKAEQLLHNAENILPVLDTLQSLKLVKIIFKAIIECIRFYPSQTQLKLQAVRVLHQLLLLRHIPLKCDIYRSIAMAIKKHFVALMNSETYSEGIQNQSLLSALVLGVPLSIDILQQIVHDSYNGNPHIMQNAEEILLLLLRSYHFYGAAWENFLEILLPVLPLIQSYSHSKEICEVLLKLLNPDSKQLPFLALLRGNITFMFSNDASVRSEVLTRLVYMLNSLPQSSDYLPSIMEISDVLPNDLCIFQVSRDFRHVFAATESYFELSAMHNLLTLLDMPDIEPDVRKTTLLQLDVICNNWDMTALFCEEQAHCLILRALENSLQKISSNYYIENIVPTINILAKLLICDDNFCKELANIPNVYVLLLRAMFHYAQTLQVRQNTSICLFLLLFRNFLVIKQEDKTVEAPLIVENLNIPIKCKFQSQFTPLTNYTSFNISFSQIANLFSNELEWNAYLRQVIIHSFCGSSTFSKKQIEEMPTLLDICPPLLVQHSDVHFLHATDSNFIIRNLLKAISNATDQRTLVRTANSLNLQLIINHLEYGTMQLPIDIMDSIFSIFSRYLQSTPGNAADFQVYTCALDLLHLCVRSSLTPVIRNLIHMLRSNINHGIFAMFKNSELPLDIYCQLSEFCYNLLSAATISESTEMQSADSIFRCNFFELLHELILQYYSNRKLSPVRCLLKILKNLTNTNLYFPVQMLFKYCKSFLQLSREISSSTQTGTQWHRDCLISFIQIFINLPEDIKAMVSSKMLKHLIGLCGHNDGEVRALAWTCLGNIANVNIESRSGTINKKLINFQNGVEFLTHELAYLPGGFIGSCLCTFLSNTEINLVRNLAGQLFVLLLSKVYPFEKALKLLELHLFFTFAYSSLETCILDQYLPLHSPLLTILNTDENDQMEITTCEIIRCYSRICIALLKLNSEFVEELCEKPLMFKLFELLKMPMMKTNPCQYEMCADICQLYAICSRDNFIFLQRTLCHDERWLLCFFELLEMPNNISDSSIVNVLQLLLVLLKEDFVCKMFCKKLSTSLSPIQKLTMRSLNKGKVNSAIQRHTLAVLNFLLIKSQPECIDASFEDPPQFSVLLENEVELRHKSSELCIQKKMIDYKTNKENIPWNFCLKIATKNESLKDNKLKQTKIDGIEKEKKSLSTLIFIDVLKIFDNLYPCNSCKFESSPSLAKIQICETLALLLKLTPHSRLVAKNSKLFDKILQILKTFFKEFNSCSSTYVRRYGEQKKVAIIKNFQILFSIMLGWYSPNAAILTDEIDCLEFSKIVIQTWPWLTHSLELKLLILKVCSYLSERSLAVCRQFSIPISTYDHSILQLIIKTVISETQKMKTSNDLHLAIVNTGLRVMMNCCACTEGRFTINKEHVLDVVDGMYPINAKSPKIRNDLFNSWLQFWELFSRYTEGGKARNLNAICSLIDRNTPCAPMRLFCLKILRNMCFLSNNRYQLITSCDFIYILSKIVTQPFNKETNMIVSFEEQLIVCVSIWQLISGGVKYMAILRGTKLASELRILYEKLTNTITQISPQSTQLQFAVDVINILDIIFNIFSE